MFYSEHVVSSLRESFPSEFLLLEGLALGRKADFFDQSRNSSAIEHLIRYGLVRKNQNGGFEIAIKVVEEYLIRTHAMSNKHSFTRWVVPNSQRVAWVKERRYRVLKDFRLLDQMLQATGVRLFGPVILPEADKFDSSPVVNSEADFQSFINACNRTFVESIEQYGVSINKKIIFGRKSRATCPSCGVHCIA